MIVADYTRDTVNIWFPDQKEPIYDESDPDLMAIFESYWKKETERMIDGFYLADGKVFISGWLYWHTVYWTIGMYVEIVTGKTKRKVRKIVTPLLRDIEWDISNDFLKCEEEGRFYILVGSRDFGKSIIAASRAGWGYTLFDKSESVISSGEKTFIKLATDKIEDGLIHIHPVLKKQRLENDWSKTVKAGWKDKVTNQTSDKSSLSIIHVRNYDMGNKTMAANGTRPSFHLIDEIGAFPNLIGCIKDSDGCWWSGSGNKPSCLTMLAGTGGDMEIGAEASEIFNNPTAYNMLDFENIWEPSVGSRIGRFVPGTKAKMEYKEPKTLAEHLGIDHPDLKKITILISNEERAKKEWWDVEYRKARSSGNQKAIIKFKAYWPLTPSDSFLVLKKNNFNIEAAKAQQARLKGIGKTGIPVELYHDGEKIRHLFSDKLPITEFPLKDENPDAPVVIYELPIDDNPPFGLYTAGVDPYRHDKAEGSDSLGAVYIFKRIHDIASEKYQNLIVASFVARPDNKEQWNNTARLLIKYYNAYTLCENDEYGFIEYMVYKGDAQYLSPQPNWLKEISPNSNTKRDYGIHRSNLSVRNHLDSTLKRYLDEVIDQKRDESGSVISETLGVTRVFDIMLLEEIIKFNADGNFDRIIAAELAIALAEHLNPQFYVGSVNTDPRFKSYYSTLVKQSSRTVLEESSSDMFGSNKRRKNKLFY